MDSYQDRLQLYLISGNASLLNQSMSQADSLFKAAIKLIQEVPTKIGLKKKKKNKNKNK
jgi:hypothetical protein